MTPTREQVIETLEKDHKIASTLIREFASDIDSNPRTALVYASTTFDAVATRDLAFDLLDSLQNNDATLAFILKQVENGCLEIALHQREASNLLLVEMNRADLRYRARLSLFLREGV